MDNQRESGQSERAAQGQGNWTSLKSKMRQQWGKLTDSDFDSVQQNPEDVVVTLQKSYGYTKDQARDEFERFKDRNSSLFASSPTSEEDFDDERLLRDDNDPASVDPSTNERRQ